MTMRCLVLAAVALSLAACAPVAAQPGAPSAAPTSSSATSTVVPMSSPDPTSEPAGAPPVSTPPTAAPTSDPTPVPWPGKTTNVQITLYGSYDNDPKGSLAIDDPVLHKTAGGVGTFADPLTFASPIAADGKTMAYTRGQRIYVPSLQKYFLREDSCAKSWTAKDGCGELSHVDLYIGNPSASKAVLKCEDALTPDGLAPIVVDPPANLTVDPAPLWSDKTGKCAHLY